MVVSLAVLLTSTTTSAYMYDKTHQLCADVLPSDLNINGAPAKYTDHIAYFDDTAYRTVSKYGQSTTYTIAADNHFFYLTRDRKRNDITFKNANSQNLFFVYGITYYDDTSRDPNTAQDIRYYLFGDQECRIPANIGVAEVFVQQIEYKR